LSFLVADTLSCAIGNSAHQPEHPSSQPGVEIEFIDRNANLEDEE
jgi:hypothetical protein